ncbi:N-acetylglucosamine-6-phosphate deacetylase [Aeromonas schubertii]|uniref:N-acetylglucosamine-6-phosphate deacetylase n=1 Tax=Aeromonas schubertii TaxID=652 RepID=A0A0S2SLI5_9GAMM|nr:N-acetylglucosamine-6-phosphate deacetylase [Aeromonas schubertii]ALP42600.1 N-acetylglucosamine-6-phosphate deacetylase [Aeromonas schubertii]
MYALHNCTLYTGEAILTGRALLIEGDTIAAIVDEREIPTGMARHDLQGANLTAGFIDLQLNGCGGVMFNDAITVETLTIMQAANLKSGTTSFLPTLITSPDEDMKQAVAVTRDYMAARPNEVLGVHLEGPYTNVKRKGIHPADQIRQPAEAMIDFFCANHDVIGKITLAPERNDPAHIRRLVEAGILVSAGHTAAGYEQAMAGFDAGIRFATHLYNAMTPTINGREPGVVGAIYDRDDVYAGVIVDGHHVHYANVRLAHKILGERLVLVTDATAPAGAPQGFEQFDFCGATVYYRDGQCIDENGTLGGSALTMIEGVENLVKQVGLPLDEALRMAALYPARAIGWDSRLGSIQVGKIANLTVFNDDFKVLGTVVNGHYNQ